MNSSKLSIRPLNAFSDNYIWTLIHENNQACVFVDPGDAKPVLDFLKNNSLTPAAILITHHHWDHTGGVAELIKHFNIPVYAPNNPAIKHVSHSLKDGDHFTIDALDTHFEAMAIPGHTLDHIAYYAKPYLFSGDTLFSVGCGRLFEGTAQQMHHSLDRLKQLPDDTQIYCGHEYTLNNIDFALTIEPENQDLKDYQQHCQQLRKKNQATLPSTIDIEKRCNPFLRNNLKEFTRIRHLKDNY